MEDKTEEGEQQTVKLERDAGTYQTEFLRRQGCGKDVTTLASHCAGERANGQMLALLSRWLFFFLI